MPIFDEDDFLEEVIHCLNVSDIIKGEALFQYFPQNNIKLQQKVLYELSKASYYDSFPLLDYLYSLKNIDSEITDRIYDLILEISYNHPNLLVQYLKKESLRNKIAFMKIAGDLQLEEAVPALIEILNKDYNKNILSETLKTLGTIGTPICIPAIADFLYYGDEDLKKVAISALADIASPNAIQRLSEAIREGNETNKIIVDALSSIQNQASLEKINGLLVSNIIDVRNIAIDHLISIGEKAVPILVENLKSNDSDLLIHTLTILGKIGDETAVQPIKKILHKNPNDPNIRFTAYEALGRLPSTKSAISLTIGLEDPIDQVRIAAAKAINKNLSNVLIAGLKNLIATADEHAKTIVTIFIDSISDKVFKSLIDVKIFADIATDYLINKSHPDVKKHFINLLSNTGLNNLAQIIQGEPITKDVEKKLTIYAVDDSKMLLNLYMKKLYKMGHNPVVFEFPAKAIEAVRNEKPDLLITDLNMPEIDGLTLTKTLRSIFDITTLPIIMITTQSDAVDNKEIIAAGVNKVLNKPFKDEELSEAIQILTKK